MNSKNFSEDFNDTVVTSIIGHIQDNNFEALKESLSNHDFLSHSLSTFKHLENSFDVDHYLFLLKNDPFVYSLLNEKEEFMDYMLDNYIINPNSRINIQAIFNDSVLKNIENYIDGKYDEYDADKDMFIYQDEPKNLKLSNFVKLIGDIGLIDKSISQKYFNRLKSLKSTYLEKMDIVEREVYFYELQFKNSFCASNIYGTFGGMLTDLIIRTDFEVLSENFDFSGLLPNKQKVFCYYDDYMNSQIMNVELSPLTTDFYDFNKDYNNNLVVELKEKDEVGELKKQALEYIKKNKLILIRHYISKVELYSDEHRYLEGLKEEYEQKEFLNNEETQKNTRKM